ncbi:MAG: hypothetical protein RLZZ360_502 [Candidatus Parcubacteria bacterium]|jgi:hypothetical protein
MWLPFVYTLLLLALFGAYLSLVAQEERRAKRLFLAHFRDQVDRGITRLVSWLEGIVRYVVKYVITLSWYYSLHAFLQVMMKSLAGAYHVLESMLIRNRDRARALRKERRSATKNHLTHIADHKAETKLTPAEERRRKDKALKG